MNQPKCHSDGLWHLNDKQALIILVGALVLVCGAGALIAWVAR